MRYFLEFSYNGKHYHGWQNQPNALTVQEVLEQALSTVLRSKINLTGAGRTDAGVHAKQMYAHFDFNITLNSDEIKYKLNSFLPLDISIYKFIEVNNDAHARFDAISRTYEYWISNKKNPFLSDYAYHLKYELDVKKMNDAAKVLFEYEDFQCFSKSNTDVKTYLCKIMKAEWSVDDEKLIFTIKADRFLRNMVRAVVGTLLEVGLNKSSKEDVKKVIESKNRSNAGTSVPAHGLYLTKVEYPASILKK